MSRLKLQVQISVDGFVSTGPDDEQKWVTWAWEEIRDHVLGLADSADTILLGRKLAVDYIPYWQDVYTRPDDPMHEVAQRIVPMQKVVFTQTISPSDPRLAGWHNTTLATGDLIEEVRRLKSREGKDIMAYGGSSFVSALIREGLVDEFHLFINPVVLGRGEPIFNGLDHFKMLDLKQSTVYDCGIILAHYELKK